MRSSRIRSQPASRPRRDRRLAVADGLHLVPVAREVVLEPERDVGLVFDDQDARPCVNLLRRQARS